MLEGRLSIKNNRIPLIEPVSKETVPQRGRFSDFQQKFLIPRGRASPKEKFPLSFRLQKAAWQRPDRR